MADADREDEGASPLDEEAAWAALVAGYDAEPEPGTAPSWPEAENVPAEPRDDPGPEQRTALDPVPPTAPPTRSIVVHPVISGPRNYELDEDDEDAHFVPPEPPPLPEADLTTKFGWIAVLGGPLLLIVFVLLQLELAWWVILVGVGGFLGGFATLVSRMRTGEDDDDLPGGGAVV
ncbi:hypothetical protein [Actinacidiphila yeochonensis]|uniref:hypothetical protein n=1 Tax=Actinacidiphila yeochonensis TaxID=89050 RepID=UPI00099DD7CB|nr:hypothetical protein [Actinacidiphila yeochonensis]